jgi:hypothetical protein
MNRTYRVVGKAFSDTDNVQVELSVNNNIVFNNMISASPLPVPDKLDQSALGTAFEFELPTEITGTISIKIKVINGYFMFSGLISNYSGYTALWNSSESTPTIFQSPETLFVPQSYAPPHADIKTNVQLNGVDITVTANTENPEHPYDTTGWHYLITLDSELTLDYYINPIWIVTSVPAVPPETIDTYPVTVLNTRGVVTTSGVVTFIDVAELLRMHNKNSETVPG